MTLTVDLSGVEAWAAGDILPPGTHRVRVMAASEGESSNGHPQLEVELEAIDGEAKGGTIRDWITVTPATAGKVKQFLEALGIEADGKVEISADKLVGKCASIIVRTETYDGKERSKVKAYSEPAAASGAGSDEFGDSKSDDTDLPF